MVRCLERPETEWPAALDAAAREYPEHAQELRARVRLLAGVDALLEAEEPRAFVPEDFGDFTGLCPIGRGGMGIVYRAHQVSLRREVAIKVIRPERLLQEGAIERFRREVETVAQLRSPHVVAIHSVGETRQGEARLPWFAMELLGGASLAGAIATIGPRAPETLTGADLFAAVGGEGHELPGHFEGSWVDGCLRTALQLTRALEHAHERGVLHRDVKPGNAILEPSGRTVLFDFGLTATRSTPSARLTESGQPVGTLVYMAPEQLRGADVDERADIYALGATLYELLTLLPPFEGSSALDLGRAIEAGAPSPIRARNRRVPVDAQTVCLTAMARAPRDRYASAAALARDLENVLAGRPIEARPPGPWTRARRWAQRHPAGAASAGLLATLLVGGPTVLFAQERVHNAALGRGCVEDRDHLPAQVDGGLRLSLATGHVGGGCEERSEAPRCAGVDLIREGQRALAAGGREPVVAPETGVVRGEPQGLGQAHLRSGRAVEREPLDGRHEVGLGGVELGHDGEQPPQGQVEPGA